MPSLKPKHIILLSTGCSGKDGVSRVTSEAMRALEGDCDSLEVWLLGESRIDEPEMSRRFAHWRVRTADSDRRCFGAWGLRSGLSTQSDTLAVVMHVHLVPAVVPLMIRGARIGVFLHGIEVWCPLTLMRRHVLRHCDLLLANSKFTVERFRCANPQFDRSEVRVCLLGTGSPEEVPQAGDEHPACALMVGRMEATERYKGHDLLLDCWPAVRRAAPAAELWIVGEGNDRPRLQEKSRRLGLEQCVTFKGAIPDAELEQLYRRCSFFVMPSREEGFGLVFLEAMRAGKACIAGDGAAREVVEHGVTGFITPPGDPVLLERLLLQLFADSALRQRMGRASLERYSRYFTGAAFADRLRAALEIQHEK